MNTPLITRAAAALLLGTVAVLAQAADINGHSRPGTDAAVQPEFKPGKPRVWDAVVSDTGVLSRGSASSASALNTTGAYQIDFPVDVSQCVYVGNLGSLDVGTPASGQLVTARRVSVPTAVFVQTTDNTSANVARAFHLVVVCH
jgi:hypothetical protein